MLKDVLVHLDGSTLDDTALAYGQAVAAAFDAHLTGFFVNPLPTIVATGNGFGSADLAIELQDQAVAQGDKTAKALAPKLDALGVRSEFRRIDALPGQSARAIAREARMADLTILPRPLGHDDEDTKGVSEGVLFDCGRGVLFVPPGGTPPQSWDTVMIAWNGSREAARAVTEAMPFLESADNVVVVLADDRRPPEEDGMEPGADIARHLSRHDVTVELRHITEWDEIHAAILNEAGMSGADLLVMGGYGHSRLREWVIGGVTRGVLTEAGLPVLMAH